ncbi:MAG: hypothetical protein D3916_05220 [Candidatus Electrothrix sp. MAN1_4]|nr:hypothetical protein [Candidatus Electrothrix sp. MAN1_4]
MLSLPSLLRCPTLPCDIEQIILDFLDRACLLLMYHAFYSDISGYFLVVQKNEAERLLSYTNQMKTLSFMVRKDIHTKLLPDHEIVKAMF